MLFPKAEAEEVIPKKDVAVLNCAIGSIDHQEHKKGVKSKSILLPIKIVATQRSVLDDNIYGPGNIPH